MAGLNSRICLFLGPWCLPPPLVNDGCHQPPWWTNSGLASALVPCSKPHRLPGPVPPAGPLALQAPSPAPQAARWRLQGGRRGPGFAGPRNAQAQYAARAEWREPRGGVSPPAPPCAHASWSPPVLLPEPGLALGVTRQTPEAQKWVRPRP